MSTLSLKIIATGDWHLGSIFHGIDRLEEHKHFLAWLLDRIDEHRPDALLVAGDVFDNANPSAASQRLYYDFLVRATECHNNLKIIVTAGNHDSAARLEAPREVLSCLQVETRGNVSRTYSCHDDGSRVASVDFDDLIIPVGERLIVLAVPFLRNDIMCDDSYSHSVMTFLKALNARARQKHPDAIIVMMAHMYAQGADISAKDASEKIIIGGQEQVDMGSWPDHPDYLTCGHIHKRQHIRNTHWARYSGSVLPMSFAEKDYQHGVDLITFEPNRNPRVQLLEYVPQHRLMLIPDEQDVTAYSLAQLKKMLKEKLPLIKNVRGSEDSTYVALRVDVSTVTNDGINELEKLAEERNAIICRNIKMVPIRELTTSGDEEFMTVDEILNRDPLEAINETFAMKHGLPMSERQLHLLASMLSKTI